MHQFPMNHHYWHFPAFTHAELSKEREKSVSGLLINAREFVTMHLPKRLSGDA
jgi:hypothetical protein